MLPLVCIQIINREPCEASLLQRALVITDTVGLEGRFWGHFPGLFSQTIY